MIIMISGLVTFLAGVFGLVRGFITADLLTLIGGGFISIIGIVLLSTFFIISYIQAMDNRNISALNEIIVGLSSE